tara:strand:- start:63 stop:227 length:165 start_codon:yes stop_codon:yes gene_type:complete
LKGGAFASDILLLNVCDVIAGAEGWEEIADCGELHLDWLKCYGGLPVYFELSGG